MTHLDQQLSERHRFFLREQTKSQLSRHYRRMDQNTKKQPNRFDITLTLGSTIDEIMKMTTLGNIDVTSTISLISHNANVCIDTLIGNLTPSVSTPGEPSTTSDLAGSLQYFTVQTTPVAAAVDVWTGSVSLVQSITQSTLGGPRTWLKGGIFTKNNELLMTDYKNRRLLLFDDTYSYRRGFSIDGEPSDIARGRADNEVLVAVDARSILKFKLQHGQLSLISKINIPYLIISGIAVLGDNILVSTNDNVRVMTGDGKVIKTIQQDGGYQYIATSPSSSTVYHRDDNDVVCRRLDSEEEVYRYRDPGLRTPKGIGLDRDDNVYVCGYDYGNVHLVSADGSRGRVLVSKLSDITHPVCVVVHPTKREFVVTSHYESTSFEVYRIDNK